jgi:hypothetical protein
LVHFITRLRVLLRQGQEGHLLAADVEGRRGLLAVVHQAVRTPRREHHQPGVGREEIEVVVAVQLGLAGVRNHLGRGQEQRLLLLGQLVGVAQITTDPVGVVAGDHPAVVQRVGGAPGAVPEPGELGVELAVHRGGIDRRQAAGQGVGRGLVHLDQVGEQAVLGLDPLGGIFGQMADLGVGGGALHEDEGHGRGHARHRYGQDRDDRQQSPRERRSDVGYGSPLLHALVLTSEASTRIYTWINDLDRDNGFVTGSVRPRLSPRPATVYRHAVRAAPWPCAPKSHRRATARGKTPQWPRLKSPTPSSTWTAMK